MNGNLLSRRELLELGLWTAVPGGLFAQAAIASPAAAAAPSRETALHTLDRFIAGYCAAMNAPGLTLGLAGAEGPIRISSYGYVDLAAKTKVLPSHLFEIGSITKSFVALLILQLHEEGKVDLEGPIHDYLPWLSMQTDFGEILVHHLLTHSSGMPDDPPLIPSSPERRPRQSFKPGTQFHYSNWGFDVLGRLIEELDGRAWPDAVAARIFKPLGMSDSCGSITSAARARLAQSYVPLHDDRPYPRHGPLAPAGNLTVETAAGSIASTPRDMSTYMQMILNRGAFQGGRIISEESFKLFSTSHIAAPIFGPAAGYGYGIGVDTLDGHVRLRHTGGMVSFMSAIHLDLDAGLGAFASINAQLGYRPNPVAQLALRLLRAVKERGKPPAIPAFEETATVAAADDYTGVYTAADGRQLQIQAESDRLLLITSDARIPLQQSDEDTFIADHPGFDLYALLFERDRQGASPVADPPKRPIIALGIGPDWYAHARNQDHLKLDSSPELALCAGEYYSENPWSGGIVRVVQRRRQLWLDGTQPLTPIGDRLFRVGEQSWSPETAEFSQLVGSAQLLWFDGFEYRRIGETRS